MKNSFLRRRTYSLMFLATMFLSISCIDGYEEDKAWSSGVENASLESPAAEDIKFAPNADGTKLTVSWPVVQGAGGYEFSLYIVDDPENPVLVGEEKQVVDGCTVDREMIEDTYYLAKIRTLGNSVANNKEAQETTVANYNNMLEVTTTIPSGTNLTEYFDANPIPETTEHLCYELELGGEYTMNGNISIGKTQTTIRGKKANRAKIKLTNGSFVNGGAGMTLKFLDIDCADFSGGVTSNAIILMDSNFDETLAASMSSGKYIVIPTAFPVVIQSCEIKELKQYLFYDSGKKYAIGTFLIKDCVIGQNTSTFNNATIRFASGMVKDMTLTTSTFYNEVQGHSSNRLCQISSGSFKSVQPLMEVWANGSMTFTNSTFYQFPKGAQSFNSNGAMGQKDLDRVTVQNCLIVDSGEKGRFINRLRRDKTESIFTGGNNSYWYDGEFPKDEVERAVSDNSGTHLESDPQLKYLGDGKFSLGGSEQIAKRVGDPRWLPSED